MLKSKNSKQYLILTAGLGFYGIALSIHHHLIKPKINVSKQDSAININRNFLKFMSAGNKRLISSWLWIQTLLESDLERYTKKDKNNWLYHRFKSISELDPNFYENYYYGGMFLSIVKDDLIGAAEIYELGLKKFPDDYSLSFNAGFNYYFEMGDFKNGLRILSKIKDHSKTPIILKSIINKLEFEIKHDYDSSMAFLKHSYENAKDNYIKNKLEKDMYALKAERDLECLNSKNNGCDKKDFFGREYIFVNGFWKTVDEFKKYKIYYPHHKKDLIKN